MVVAVVVVVGGGASTSVHQAVSQLGKARLWQVPAWRSDRRQYRDLTGAKPPNQKVRSLELTPARLSATNLESFVMFHDKHHDSRKCFPVSGNRYSANMAPS